jgi:chromosome partitioning protein
MRVAPLILQHFARSDHTYGRSDKLDASKSRDSLFSALRSPSKLDASRSTSRSGHKRADNAQWNSDEGKQVEETNAVKTYRRIANVLRSAQRAAIEVENAPDKRKRLRTFSVQEVAALLRVKPRHITTHTKALEERPGGARGRLAFGDILRLRQALRRSSGDLRFMPGRDPNRGEGLATVVFSNFKGGSAKTTSSVHFAQYMARQGYRVLLIDLDSQGSTTAQFGIDPSTEVGLDNSFTAWTAARDAGRAIEAASLCQSTYWPTIDLVPAGAVLAEAEESLSKRSQNGTFEDVLYFDEMVKFLTAVGGEYDIAVVDTRPDVNMLMTIALHAATGLIVPARATMTDLASTGEFFAHLASYVTDFQEAFGNHLKVKFTRVMVTAYDPTDRSQEALVNLIRERFGDAVLPGEFLHSRIMGTAGFGKETLYEYEPTTDRAAYNRVVASANAVNQAIELEILRDWGRPPMESIDTAEALA